MKKYLLFVGMVLGFSTFADAAPVRYVQISTNTLTRQTGTAVIAGLNVSTATISSATISNATIGSLSISTVTVSSLTVTTYWMPPVYSSATIGAVMGQLTTSSATVVTSFVPTGLSVSITPRFTTSRIKVSASGTVSQASIVRQCYATIFRDTTDLGVNGVGFSAVGNSGTATALMVPWSVPNFYDSPGTTSSVTYTVRIYTSNGASACTFNEATSRAFITVEEIR